MEYKIEKRGRRAGAIARLRFLKAYEETFGNITKSCEYAGISRQTFYRWMRGDSPGHRGFRRNVELMRPKELRKDILEDALYEAARAGNVRAIIFGLKTFAKDRGYGPGPRTVDEFGTPLAHQNLCDECKKKIGGRRDPYK